MHLDACAVGKYSTLADMRTTLTIDDDIFEAARHQAESLHVSLNGFIQTAMRNAMAHPTPSAAGPYQPIRIRSGLRQGVTVESLSRMVDDIDDAERLGRLAQP